MTPLSAVCAALLAFPGAVAAQDDVDFKGLDIYRSRTLTAEAVRKAAGSRLDAFLRHRAEGSRDNLRRAANLKKDIEDEVAKLGGLAFVRLHYAQYVTSSERTAHIVLDVVDTLDAPVRMAFKAAPKGSVPDPGGLLAAWQDYGELGRHLLREGKLSTDHQDCPAHYCLWGSPTPELASFERRFQDGVVGKGGALSDMLANDADPAKRAAALFILSYSTDSKTYAGSVLGALADPAEEVRAAALQVLADIALYRKDVALDLDKVIAALDDPLTPNRAKALSVMVGLADNPTYRPVVLRKATPLLVALLKLHEPSQHDLAFTMLSLLSKETYGRRDYKSWEAWAAAQMNAPVEAVPAPKK